jgi:integrase
MVRTVEDAEVVATSVLLTTAIYSGPRAGELQALRWTDIDLAAGVIRVDRSWDRVTRQYVAPKSKAGRRKVPIPGVLRDALLEL